MARIKTAGLSIRQKIMGTVAILIVFAVSVSLVTYWGFKRVNAELGTITNHFIPELTVVDDTDYQLAKARRYEKEFFLYSSLRPVTPEIAAQQKQYYDNLLSYYEAIGQNIGEILRIEQEAAGALPDEGHGGDDHGDHGDDHGDHGDDHAGLLQMAQKMDSAYRETVLALPPLAARLLNGASFLEAQNDYDNFQQEVERLEASVKAMRNGVLQHLEDTKANVAEFQSNMNNGVLIALAVLVYVCVHAGTFMSQRVTAPLNTLMDGIQSVGEGKFERISVNTRDEYALIAQTFNETMERLLEYIQTDEERRQTQENLINFLEVVSEASEGNLTLNAPVTADSFGSIADAYNLMVSSLADQLLDTRSKALEVSSESQRLTEIFMNLQKGTEAQSLQTRAATEAASKTESMTRNIAEKTEQAREASEKMDATSAEGSTLVQQNMEGMQLIRITVQIINKKMKSLSERLLEIDTISQLISEVATRTTILAMNASIEAARAGDQGKGFLVISDEIKRLADQASEATRNIAGIIKAVQTEAGEVTASLEEETKTVEEQSRLAQSTGEAFMAIQRSITESDTVVEEIYNLSRNQQEFTDRTTRSIEQVAQISEEALRLVQDSAQIAEGLDTMAATLRQSLSRFQLPEGDSDETVIETASVEIAPENVTI